MVRRRRTQGERKMETRQLLLDSAVETFAKFGFHGASVDKIAEYAGFSKGAVYAHFSSKEELFLAIMEQQMNAHVQNILAVIDRHHSNTHFIETMQDYVHSIRQENRVWSMLNMEFLLYAMREESVSRKWADMIQNSIRHISDAIDQLLIKKKHQSPLTADEMAWTILSLENGMAIFHYISKEVMPEHLYGKALENILFPPVLEK
ncbi:TetR/AcrR family transcriptional regulator [Brevibacillus reuszeri]|uniref:TetR/AcrR family transcriptional regulator n=1 Tax=Brevibacillus reuszeri TaxID=54915 RepID=UPI00366D0701